MEMMSKKHVVQCCLAAWLGLLADGAMKSAIKATRRTKSAATFSSSNLTFSTTPMTVWVENPSGGSADLELIARSGTTDVCSDKVHFYPFSSVVVLFEGEFGVPSDPPGGGISTLALAAYTNGYDVHVYDEPDLFEPKNGS